jgi:uncharacterized protein YggE
MDATVTARGSAVAPAKADEGIWVVTVSSLDGTPEAALRSVGDRSKKLDVLLGRLGVPNEKRSSTGVSIREEHEWVDGRQTHRGYHAANVVRVRLADASIAGRLIEGAISRVRASVHGPAWWISPSNDARVEACRQATLEAKRKAEAYAEALGLRLGSLAEIREPGGRGFDARPLSAGRGFAAAAEPPINVDPGELQVEAVVEVTFHLET